jgi:hypothetical protein
MMCSLSKPIDPDDKEQQECIAKRKAAERMSFEENCEKRRVVQVKS